MVVFVVVHWPKIVARGTIVYKYVCTVSMNEQYSTATGFVLFLFFKKKIVVLCCVNV